jgi:glycosyltransferase involved in cell wall biosynthesis
MPKVTIIIPVYNVEQYIRQCLDSVVNQTLRDIEIICVNDGSPDGSPQILEEYAARDSRITVIHKENGGLSSARNAAYPYINGKYTLFVDSDDWIEPDLCKKTVTVAELEKADMTLFFYRCIPEIQYWYPLENFLKHHSFAVIDKMTLLGHMTAWSKLWNTQFLCDNNIKFPEGICFEDNVVHWKALLRNPKITVVSQNFYWYRMRSDSIMTNYHDKTFFDIFSCYDHIKEILLQEVIYEGEWKDLFIIRKLTDIHHRYCIIAKQHKCAMLEKIRDTFSTDEKKCLEEGKLGLVISAFFNTLNGSRLARIKYKSYLTLSKIKQKFRCAG